MSFVFCLLSFVFCLLSFVLCLLFFVFGFWSLSFVFCLLTFCFCLMFFVFCLLSFVFCLCLLSLSLSVVFVFVLVIVIVIAFIGSGRLGVGVQGYRTGMQRHGKRRPALVEDSHQPPSIPPPHYGTHRHDAVALERSAGQADEGRRAAAGGVCLFGVSPAFAISPHPTGAVGFVSLTPLSPFHPFHTLPELGTSCVDLY